MRFNRQMGDPIMSDQAAAFLFVRFQLGAGRIEGASGLIRKRSDPIIFLLAASGNRFVDCLRRPEKGFAIGQA